MRFNIEDYRSIGPVRYSRRVSLLLSFTSDVVLYPLLRRMATFVDNVEDQPSEFCVSMLLCWDPLFELWKQPLQEGTEGWRRQASQNPETTSQHAEEEHPPPPPTHEEHCKPVEQEW